MSHNQASQTRSVLKDKIYCTQPQRKNIATK